MAIEAALIAREPQKYIYVVRIRCFTFSGHILQHKISKNAARTYIDLLTLLILKKYYNNINSNLNYFDLSVTPGSEEAPST